MKKGVVIGKILKFSIIGVAVIFIVLASAAVYMTFFFSQECGTYTCFEEAMINCNRGIIFINEDRDASWGYMIKGSNEGMCDIQVKLLQAKEGELELEKLAGLDMICSYPLGTAEYPEKELNNCHGRLKEELQELIIKKLHTYLLENIGDFSQELAGI